MRRMIGHRNAALHRLILVAIARVCQLCMCIQPSWRTCLLLTGGYHTLHFKQGQTTCAGDWGFFGSYLSGGLAIVVLAVGSVAPGLLTFATDKFSQIFPDYRDRVLRHEAAHFLVGYLLGVPIVYYDLAIGREVR
jgi:hypothetical protein